MKKMFSIYEQCFPHYPLAEGSFDELLQIGSKSTHVIKASIGAGQNTIGYAVIRGNSITLLCVLENFRGRGHGAWLLREAEDYLRAKNESHILLGIADHYIFQGVPLDYGSVGFFEKYGYRADEILMNMGLSLAGFDITKLKLREPENVIFRLAKETDQAALLLAVKEAEPEFLPFFADYDGVTMLALAEQKIIGFQMLDVDGARFKIASPGGRSGSIGCVGIIPDARGQGIGLRMVAEGANWLKEQGSVSAHLLYVGLKDWYERIGFQPTSRQWMGKK